MQKAFVPGIAAGIAAGAMWGLVFVAPAIAPDFQPAQLSAGRYLAYGLVAAILVAPSWRRLGPRLTWRDWRTLACLALAGNIVYYVLLANAVQAGGVAMASLVIGLLPVAVTLAGARDRHAVALVRLLPSLLLGLAGLACIAWEALRAGGVRSLAGLACAIGALASWTLYAVWNSRALARLHGIGAHEWSLLMGLVTGVEALALAVPAFALDTATGPQDWPRFLGLVCTVALLCSVAGNALWNVTSRRLPLALTGQMIVFETLFGLLYGFLWERRGPTALDGAAIVLLMGGVVVSAAAHRGTAGTGRDGRPRQDIKRRAVLR